MGKIGRHIREKHKGVFAAVPPQLSDFFDFFYQLRIARTRNHLSVE